MTNIRDIDLFKEGIWDWTIFNDCFSPSNIRITDIDGLVERHGHFLLLEGKKEDIEIPLGQKILFNMLKKIPNWTVIIFWGIPPKEIKGFEAFGEFSRPEATCTIWELKEFIKRWFLKVN